MNYDHMGKVYGSQLAEEIELFFQNKKTDTGQEQNYQQKILTIFQQAMIEEGKEDYPRFDWLIAGLSVFYMCHVIAWKTTDSNESAASLVRSYCYEGQEKAVLFFADTICLSLAKTSDIAAIDMLLLIRAYFSGKRSERALELLVQLGEEKGLHEFVVQQINRRIAQHNELLGTLAEIDQDLAYAVCLRWLNEKNNDRKIMALKQLVSLDVWNTERHKDTQEVLSRFWKSKKLSTDKDATAPYYTLVKMAFEAGAITRKQAISRLTGVFSRRFLFPSEYETFKKALTAVDSVRADTIYVDGFARAAELKQRENTFDCDVDELEKILSNMEEKAKMQFLRRVVINTTDDKLLWQAAVDLLKYATKEEGEEIFQKAMQRVNPELLGILTQLILKVVSGHYDFKGMKRKWGCLSKLVNEPKGNKEPLVVFERLNQTAGFGREKDLVAIIPDFQWLFEQPNQDMKVILKAVLTAVSRLKKDRNKKKYYKLLKLFCSNQKEKVLAVLAQAIGEDWRGWSCSEELAYPAMEFISLLDDDYCVPLIGDVVRNKRRGADLDNSVSESCAKFLVAKAIAGNEKALDAVIATPDARIRSNVSGLLAEIVQGCKSHKMKKRAIQAMVSRFEQAMLGKGHDLYVYLEMEALEKVRHYDEIQRGFLAGLDAGLSDFHCDVGMHNALDKVAVFVAPDFYKLAEQTLKEGLKKAKMSIQDREFTERNIWSEYNKCVVLAGEQLLQLVA